MRTLIPTRLTLAAVALALAASACSTSGADRSAAPAAAPTTIVAVAAPSTEAPPAPVAGGATVELVAVTVDEFNVTTVMPAAWDQHGAVFVDGDVVVEIGVDPADNSLDPTVVGFQPDGSLTAGPHTWALFTLEAHGRTVYVGVAEIGDSVYSVALVAPSDQIDEWIPAVLTPALTAFEAGPLPDHSTSFIGRPAAGDDLGALLADLIVDTPLPAVGVTVFDGDEIIESAVAGVRRDGDPTPVALDDRFSIGSNAKAMTATLVAGLVDDGVLSWETTVADVYGDTVPGLDPAMGAVTIRQLLTHTGGLDDEAAGFGPIILEGFADDRSPVEQRADVARSALTQSPQVPVGIHLYSNVGYITIGALLDELTGTPWEELLQTRVFDPLGMDSCGFFAPGTPGTVDQPWGHLAADGGRPVDPGDAEAELGRVVAPAGLVHCDMADYATFLQSQLRGFQGSDTEIVSAAAFDAIRTPAPGSEYALGWGVFNWPDGSFVVTHAGSNERFAAQALLVPGDDIGFLVVSNLGMSMAGEALDEIADAVASRYAG